MSGSNTRGNRVPDQAARVLGAACLFAAVLTRGMGTLSAQELEPLTPGEVDAALGAPVLRGGDVDFSKYDIAPSDFEFGVEAEFDSPPPSLFTETDFYAKSGIVVPIGGGTFEDTVGTGWTFQAGIRQPLFGAHDDRKIYYLDVGGSFTENNSNGNSIVTSGAIVPTTALVDPLPAPTTLEDFFFTELDHLRSGSAHAAFGFFYFPERFNRDGQQRFWVNVRGGGRIGHVHATYRHTATPALEAAIAGLSPAITQFDLRSDTNDTDTFQGLFGNAGFGVMLHDVHLGSAYLGNVALGVELEIGHDWMDLADFSRDDTGFLTFSSLVTLTFSR